MGFQERVNDVLLISLMMTSPGGKVGTVAKIGLIRISSFIMQVTIDTRAIKMRQILDVLRLYLVVSYTLHFDIFLVTVSYLCNSITNIQTL